MTLVSAVIPKDIQNIVSINSFLARSDFCCQRLLSSADYLCKLFVPSRGGSRISGQGVQINMGGGGVGLLM